MNRIHTKQFVPYHLRQLIIQPLTCPDCRKYGSVTEDARAGHTGCTRCGLILQNQVISTDAEWRNFANDDKSSKIDPNRVGSCVQNIYLSDIHSLNTEIGTMGALKNTQIKVMKGSQSSHDRKLTNGVMDIEKYGKRLHLTRDVKNYSCELFKELMTRKEMNGKKGLNMIAGCIYIATQNLNCHRSLEYLCYELTIDKKRVKKILTELHKLKASNKIKLPIHKKGKGLIQKTVAEILSVKFGNELRLNKNTIRNLGLIARKIASLHILDGKKTATIAAVTIYLCCIVNSDETQQRCYKEISAVARISEHTIKKIFREYLYLRIKSLLPNGYGDAIAIAKILNRK